MITLESIKQSIHLESRKLTSRALGLFIGENADAEKISKLCHKLFKINIGTNNNDPEIDEYSNYRAIPNKEEMVAFIDCEATFAIKNDIEVAIIGKMKLYDELFKDLIQPIWNFLCRLNGAADTCDIGRKLAMPLLFCPQRACLRFDNFHDFFVELRQFAAIVRKMNNEEKFDPSFLTTRDKSDIKIRMKPKPGHMEQYLMKTKEDVSEDAVGSQHNYALFGSKNSIDVVTSAENLLHFLPSARVNHQGKLEMKMKDQIMFLNSPLMAKNIHQMLLCSVKKPLDKTDEDDATTTSWKPTIELHMQRHPTEEGRFVNVIVMENMFSAELMNKWPQLEDKLSFEMQQNSEKYVRVCSKVTPPPLVTFGNDRNSIKLREALPPNDMKEIEEIVSNATATLFKIIDTAILDTAEEVASFLSRDDDDDDDSATSERSRKRQRVSLQRASSTENENNDNVFELPITGENPHDCPDSVVSQASRTNKPYDHHSDSYPEKHDLCDNSEPNKYHGDLLRVSTCCFSDYGGKIVSLQHGIPGSHNLEQDQFCQQWGHFTTSESGAQVFVKKDNDKPIQIGGKSHIHIQLFGSQGELHHFIKPTKQGCVRFVHSLRHLGRFNLARRNEHHGDKAKVIRNSCHETSQLYSIFKNKIVFPSANAQDTPLLGTAGHMSIGPAVYPNGELEVSEERTRDPIVSTTPSVTSYDTAVNVEVVHSLSKKKASMVITNHKFKDEDNGRAQTQTTDVLVGYPIRIRESDGKSCRLKSGEILERSVAESMMCISSNVNMRQVFNEHRMDFLILRKFSKNTASLVDNVMNAMSGERLTSICIRGVGGAPSLSGDQPIPSHSSQATKLAPTHCIPLSQQLDDKFMSAIKGAWKRSQCINICFDLGDNNGIVYVGLYKIVRIEFKALEKKEVLQEHKDFEDSLTKWQQDAPKIIKKKLQLSDSDNTLLLSMGVPGSFIHLEPIDPDQPSRGDEEWELVTFDEDWLQKPVVTVPREKANVMWTPGDDLDYNCVNSFMSNAIKQKPLCFLTNQGIRALPRHLLTDQDQGADQDQGEQQDDSGGEENEITDMKVVNIGTSTLQNASVHASFFSRQRGVLDSDSIESDTIVPTRSFFDLLQSVDDKGELQIRSKPLLTRPVHPVSLSDVDTVILLAQISTDSYKQIKENGYFQREAEGGNVIFQCIICSIFNPSSLLELTNGKMVPIQSEAHHFVTNLSSYKWCNRILHPLFRKCWNSINCLVNFINKISTIKPNDLFEGESRSKMLESATRRLSLTSGVVFNDFQMHVIMRTIECCIDLPFGAIDKVYFGYGSTSAAKCFRNAFEQANDNRGGESIDPQKIVKWIKQAWEKSVRDAYKTADPFIENELKVLQLRWDEDGDEGRGLLKHRNGREFDLNDIEHSLCFFYVLHQHTLPSRNTSSSVKIDGEKYLPIRFSSTQYNTAAELPIMKDFNLQHHEIKTAYLALVQNEQYKNRYLDKIFTIDIKTDELKEKGIIQDHSK